MPTPPLTSFDSRISEIKPRMSFQSWPSSIQARNQPLPTTPQLRRAARLQVLLANGLSSTQVGTSWVEPEPNFHTPVNQLRWLHLDAPDITSLDATGPLSTAKLGRVGQQCDPPRIANVIGRFLLRSVDSNCLNLHVMHIRRMDKARLGIRSTLLGTRQQPCATEGCMRGICIAQQTLHRRSQDTRSRIGRRRGLWPSLNFGEQSCQVTGSVICAFRKV